MNAFDVGQHCRSKERDRTCSARTHRWIDRAGTSGSSRRLGARIQALFCIVSTLTLCGVQAHADSGDLDSTFGVGGLVLTDFAGGSDMGRDMALQPDGKIVAVGSAHVDGTDDFALARYNADGTLDDSFGVGGLVITDFAGGADQARAVALQLDGRIVAVGRAFVGGDNDFALARYNSDGTRDDSFGDGGLVTTDFAGGADFALAVAVQTDGKIVAAGRAFIGGADDFAVARYNTDGSLDDSFGDGGLANTDFAGGLDRGNDMILQPDGKIVVAGRADDTDFALVRYNGDGTLDAGFGTGGLVMTDFDGSYDTASGVVLQLDGKIVAVGQSWCSGCSNGHFGLARYNPDGSLDSATFGSGGLVTTGFSGTAEARGVVLQADGRIVAAGSTGMGEETEDFILARYNTDGSLDDSFAIGGVVTTDFAGGMDRLFRARLQDDGKFLVVGRAAVDGTYDFALARYEGDPVVPPCPDFTGDGIVGPYDLAMLLNGWGPNPDHPADLDGDGVVGPADLSLLIMNWGPCE